MATAKKKGTLLDLATAQIKMTDDQKALEMVNDLVEQNENVISNELFAAKQAAKAAVKHAQSLESNVNATASDIIDASRSAKLAEKYVEEIQAIIDRRF
jgi:hypothetical protein